MSGLRDLVIIGGGAAGIGAAREARARGIAALIVEAKDRLGGRAHSIDWNGCWLDLGCTWLHSAERNSLRIEAERYGASIDRSETRWFSQFHNLGFSPDEQKQAWTAFEQLEERMRLAPPSSDRASDVLEPGNPWNAFLNVISGYVNGAPLDEVSVSDWLAYDNAASNQNLRLWRGYGSLIESLGAGLEHRLATPVIAISRLRDSVQIETAAGIIEAERAIVCVPTSVLRKIRFDPPIEGLFEAAAKLPLGVADKLFLALENPDEFPRSAHLLGNPRSIQTGSYFIRPMGMPVVEGFFGGAGASALGELDDHDVEDFAVGELAKLLGSDIRKRLKLIARSCWARDCWIKGGYSHALPGCAPQRLRFVDAGDERIAFAGEAVSPADYSTAHGAFDSGIAAVSRMFSRKD